MWSTPRVLVGFPWLSLQKEHHFIFMALLPVCVVLKTLQGEPLVSGLSMYVSDSRLGLVIPKYAVQHPLCAATWGSWELEVLGAFFTSPARA